MSKEYDKYIKEHRENVVKAYDWLTENLPELFPYKARLKGSLNWHDISKYDDAEYSAYDNYFYIYKDNRTKSIIDSFNKAFLRHIIRNQHHWQHWVLIHDDPVNGKPDFEAIEMPIGVVVEMICDWMSFSIKKGDMREVVSWYEAHKSSMILHENTRKKVEEIINAINEVTKK